MVWSLPVHYNHSRDHYYGFISLSDQILDTLAPDYTQQDNFIRTFSDCVSNH